MLFIELQNEHEVMRESKYYLQIGATVACTNIMIKATKVIGRRGIKGDTKDCFLFDSWFSSKKSAESEMSLGAELISMV